MTHIAHALFIAAALLPAAAAAQGHYPAGRLLLHEGFDTSQSARNWGVIDNNSDGDTWQWRTGAGGNAGAMVCFFNTSNASDDWLLTPPMSVEGDKVYQVTFKAWGESFSNTERLALGWGEGENPTSLNSLGQTYTFNSSGVSPTVTFRPGVDGQVRFGFHALSAANQAAVWIDDVEVREVSAAKAPAAATAFTATPAADGSRQAALTFTAPARNNDGVALESLTSIEVYRDTSLIHTIASPAPGATLSCTDATASQGVNTYRVFAYNEAGVGLGATAQAYVGNDVPGAVTQVTLRQTDEGYTLHWKAPTAGANRQHFDPATVRYKVYLAGAFNNFTYLKTANDTVTTIDYSGTVQVQAAFAVAAFNEAGEGEKATSNELLIGDAYLPPLVQNFDGWAGQWTYYTNDFTDADGHYWWRIDSNSWTHFAPSTNGALWWTTGSYYDETSFNTGKINLSQATRPVLTFDYYAHSLTGVRVEALLPDQSVVTLDEMVNAQTTGSIDAAKQGWKTRTIDLAALKGQNNVVIRFHGIAENENETMGLDNLSIVDQVDRNLAVRLEVPARAFASKPSTATVTVTNLGAQPAAGYSVSLLVNGENVDEQFPADTLTSGKSLALNVPFVPQVGVEQVSVSALVQLAGDLNAADDTSKVYVLTVGQPDMPRVTDLTATQLAGTANVLRCTPIVPQANAVTDDVECYPAFSLPGDGHYLEYEYNIGPWYNFDADQEYSLDVPGYAFKWEEEAFAFITFNPDSVTTTSSDVTAPSQQPSFVAHSGKQFLAAFTMKDDWAIGNRVSDWLISPELTGDAQQVSFWVKSLPESNGTLTFQVAYSTTDRQHDSFTHVALDTVLASEEWTQVTVPLPDGAKYFALHHTTPLGVNQMLMVDDIAYTTGTGQVLGYNIYRDGQLIDTVDSLPYIDSEGGDHTYQVTVLYNSGESGLSNEARTAKATFGDLNGDGVADTTDVTALVTAILAGNASPAFDLDGSSTVDTSDVTLLVSHLLSH